MRPTVIFSTLILTLLLLKPIKADDTEIENLYNKGLKEYHLGHFEEAAKAFEGFLEKEPTSKMVLKLLDQSSTRPLVDMYHNKILRGIAARILRIPSDEVKKYKTDDDRTISLVNELLRADFRSTEESRAAVRDAQEKLIVIGAPAVPFMLEYLGVENAETLRSTIVITINGIGEEAGLPLIQGLRHENPLVRSNCASLLGLIKDVRGIPAIKALHENDKNKIVLENCEKSLFLLAKKTVSELPEARLLFMQQADDYLHKDPRVMRDFLDESFFLFSFNKKENKIRRVDTIPGYMWHLEMAEECCYRALSTPGDTPDKDVYPLMSNVYYNQLDVLDGLLKQRLNRGLTEDKHKAEYEKLKAHRTELRKAILFGPTFGSDNLHETIQKSITERNSYVTEKSNHALRKIAGSIQHTQFINPLRLIIDKKLVAALNVLMAKTSDDQKDYLDELRKSNLGLTESLISILDEANKRVIIIDPAQFELYIKKLNEHNSGLAAALESYRGQTEQQSLKNITALRSIDPDVNAAVIAFDKNESFKDQSLLDGDETPKDEPTSNGESSDEEPTEEKGTEETPNDPETPSEPKEEDK